MLIRIRLTHNRRSPRLRSSHHAKGHTSQLIERTDTRSANARAWATSSPLRAGPSILLGSMPYRAGVSVGRSRTTRRACKLDRTFRDPRPSPAEPCLPAEQNREASADAGNDERHDHYNSDDLGVHRYGCSRCNCRRCCI